MELPGNWVLADIEETLLPFENGQTLRQGWSPQCENFPAKSESDWGVLKTTAIQDGDFQPQHNKQLPSKLDPDPPLEVHVGDLLLTCAGPRVRCGVVCLVRKTRPRLMVSGKMYRFRSDPRIVLPEYLESFLRSHDTKKRIDEMKTGISDSGLNITLGRFKVLKVPIPPLAEQRRIVAKIEELFSELDKGIETLKTAKAQLAVYRQAILKDAFEGKLTAGWRADHRDHIESSEQLLARVCTEREARYEKQLSDWKTAVQKWESGNQKDSRPCKPRNLSIVALPLKEEFAHLPQLAEGWTWLRLRSCNVDVSDGPFGSNLKTSDYVGAGVRVVRLENIGVMKFIEEKESFITEEKYRLLSDYTVSPGDIVFSSFITERTRVAMVPPSIEKAVNKADCFSLRSHGSVLLNRYLCVFLSSRLVYTELESVIHGVGRPRINTTQLKELFVPVCSPSEQIAVMQEIDLQQSVLDEMESDIETNLQKAEALRQSILKKAFAGELVPQDPSDEPASVLLERIREERAEKTPRVASTKPKNRGLKPRPATT